VVPCLVAAVAVVREDRVTGAGRPGAGRCPASAAARPPPLPGLRRGAVTGAGTSPPTTAAAATVRTNHRIGASPSSRPCSVRRGAGSRNLVARHGDVVLNAAVHTLLADLERYYDAVPRSDARVEDFGPLTLFVREARGWSYYARPTRGSSAPIGDADVERVRARQRELGVPESFEWVAENCPTLRAAVERAGLAVHEYPLMVLDGDRRPDTGQPPAGLAVRMLGPDDPALPSALAVANLAFAEPGTAQGDAGVSELDGAARLPDNGSVAYLSGRITAGRTLVAAAVRDGRALCSGQHQPVGSVTEIVGVGTLPAARRRGLGALVTAALVADARSRGIATIFLSAGSSDVARIYARLGFRRIGTALAAEPAG
jgi:ribosomal protein S18 acetylase RimI-like enzyme